MNLFLDANDSKINTRVYLFSFVMLGMISSSILNATEGETLAVPQPAAEVQPTKQLDTDASTTKISIPTVQPEKKGFWSGLTNLFNFKQRSNLELFEELVRFEGLAIKEATIAALQAVNSSNQEIQIEGLYLLKMLVSKGYAIKDATAAANQAILSENDYVKQLGNRLLKLLEEYSKEICFLTQKEPVKVE